MGEDLNKRDIKNRFDFGKNWTNFLSRLDETRILEAERSLRQMLELKSLVGKTFLDIGSGSGLFSLGARRLGAKVHSFDYDALSVACTKELKNRFFGNDLNWTIEQGNVLDKNYLGSLGQFDIVYAWGVLHHTGNMSQALENVVPLVVGGGRLFLSIYNDQGTLSLFWRVLKKFYVQSSKPIRILVVLWIGMILESGAAINRLIRKQNPFPFKYWAEKKKSRGMSVWHDLVDWVGGYPFEVAKPEKIFEFYQGRGFLLKKLKTCGISLGCNEFVFMKAF
ncbi:MAG: class I SAM-dependent methyltransferase [Thermodesulfobacteriota bacterium]|jgi:2-polyprenyl-6-hydroxyphenyl methylase/3-demethylubiquinone-9 3-methyltransferase